ncbi:MAG: hypothetical protein HN382_03890 [Gammaproteobacteria bacterium]|jgi:septation ring formation regulator EzrA|nr:hypothetical protein [Gammaproteobacteria bacterium]MBT4810331.1 hypothetical protein [Thiotrichales bacterium]MBT3966909.1 hypothetical protein [Gammaproteobacteria bacterium]MBT4329109.1 hypothetical protein [Gammaproteobacteria bacterium]MBT5634555.1 hypothetical protein [Gammaproteobacteria bacterium]
MSEVVASPSNAESPDLDWSQVRETVRMFRVGVSAIEYSMSTGDESISTLIEAFTKMNTYMKEIKQIARDVDGGDQPEQPEGYEQMLTQLDGKCDMVINDLRSAVISFQFYDRLTQQLNHIASSLDNTADLVGDQNRIFNPTEWSTLQKQVYGSFTMEEGKILFEALLAGDSKEIAINKAKEYGNRDADNLELF